jgi:hypothetical protein
MPADGLPRDVALVVDILVTWVGAAALSRYAWALSVHSARGLLESRARLLIGMLAAMLFIRGFAWLAPNHRWLDFLVFLPVSLLPIAMTLFAEALLRRHAPLWIKTVATSLCAAAFVANCARLGTHTADGFSGIDAVLLGAVLITMLALAWLFVRRDRASLSASENALVRVCALLAAVGLPLVVTDFRTTIGMPPVRLGTLGALLLCYSLVRTPEDSTRLRDWFRDIARLLVKAVVACVLLVLALGTANATFILPLSVLAVALLLAFSILDRLRDATVSTTRNDLLRWLGQATPHSASAFAAELAALPLTSDAILLEGADLAPYDSDGLVKTFSRRVVYSLAELRRMRDADANGARAADELTDMLERRGATHVALVSRSPARLLVVTLPELGYADDTALALTAVARRAERAVAP